VKRLINVIERERVETQYHPLTPTFPPAFFTQHKNTYPVSNGAARTEGKALGNGGGEATHHPTACDFGRRKREGRKEV
jgi:hypothetical protein